MEESSPILQWIETPIPDTLWHYTSMQGFHGITSSREIHASDCRFLNDREEIVHARRIAHELIPHYVEKDSYGLEQRRVLSLLVGDIFDPDDGMFSPTSLQCFVASFSAKADSLSQWRAYSHASTGACICFGINRGTLPPSDFYREWRDNRFKNGFPARFAPCVYRQTKKGELLRFAINQIVGAFQQAWLLSQT